MPWKFFPRRQTTQAILQFLPCSSQLSALADLILVLMISICLFQEYAGKSSASLSVGSSIIAETLPSYSTKDLTHSNTWKLGKRPVKHFIIKKESKECLLKSSLLGRSLRPVGFWVLWGWTRVTRDCLGSSGERSCGLSLADTTRLKRLARRFKAMQDRTSSLFSTLLLWNSKTRNASTNNSK